jgi:hypothetical protein
MEEEMWTLTTIAGASLVAASVAFAGHSTSETPEWRAELRSSGGFSGRGAGGVVVQADGTISLIRFGLVRGQKDWETECSERLPEKIKPVAEALRAARDETWRDRYTPRDNPTGCCDQLQWDLEVTRTTAGQPPATQRTSWIGDDVVLPENLARLRAALVEVWKDAKSSCAAVR